MTRTGIQLKMKGFAISSVYQVEIVLNLCGISLIRVRKQGPVGFWNQMMTLCLFGIMMQDTGQQQRHRGK